MNPVETILTLLQEDALFSQPWEQKRNQTALLTHALRSLSPEEAKPLIQQLLQQWEQRRQIDWLLGQVNATVPGALLPFHAALIERQVFYPGWLYLGAAASTRDPHERYSPPPMKKTRMEPVALPQRSSFLCAASQFPRPIRVWSGTTHWCAGET